MGQNTGENLHPQPAITFYHGKEGGGRRGGGWEGEGCLALCIVHYLCFRHSHHEQASYCSAAWRDLRAEPQHGALRPADGGPAEVSRILNKTNCVTSENLFVAFGIHKYSERHRFPI